MNERAPNAIDFWRGYALVCIFVNHVPGIRFEHLTLRDFSISDSAELFVFLAGWALRLGQDRRLRSRPPGTGMTKSWKRALELHVAHLSASLCALAILIAAATFLDAPSVLTWMHAGEFFDRPAGAVAGMMLLTYQLQFFDILPLYVVFMLAAPLMLRIDAISPKLLLVLSVALYLAASAARVNFPLRPGSGTWFFNPLTWQLDFVLGYLVASRARFGPAAARLSAKLWWPALGIVCIAAICAALRLVPDPTVSTGSVQAYLFSKTFFGPARLVQFAALAVVVAPVFPLIVRFAPKMANLGSLLGRNSLPVFWIGSSLSLLGQIVRFSAGSSISTDLGIVLAGIPVLIATARISEWTKKRDAVASRQALSYSSV